MSEVSTLKLVIISGTLVGSKTEIALQKSLQFATEIEPQLEIEFINLKDFNVEMLDGRRFEKYNDDTKYVVQTISDADCYIIGSPVFQGSLPGALKNIFDHLPPKALRGKPVGFIATGSTYQHYLVIENQLKPIAGYFRSYVAPGSVYINDSHFNEHREIVDEDALQRIRNLVIEVLWMNSRISEYALFTETS